MKTDRLSRLLPGGTPRWIRCYDNGGETFDRYTVVYTGRYKTTDRRRTYVGMSEHPFHPQGFGQHGQFPAWEPIDRPSYKHLGKKITFQDLPPDCKRLVLYDYKEL